MCVQTYQWHNDEAVVEWLSEQLDEQNKQKSIIESNVHLLAREYALQHISRYTLSYILC